MYKDVHNPTRLSLDKQGGTIGLITVFPLEYPVLYEKKDFYYRAITAYSTKMIGATSPDKHNLALWHVKLKDSGVSSVCNLKPIIVVDFFYQTTAKL